RGARHRSGALHDAHGQGSLACFVTRARDRRSVLRRGGSADRRDAARQTGLRPLTDRRPLGPRARAGARRGDGHLRRARPRAPRRRPDEAAVARESPGERVPLADTGLTGLTKLRAVLFDVDFTLCRPGPELSAERYARIAARHGITLDTSRYGTARDAAVLNLRRHPELLHDESIWHRFTEEIFIGMGGLEAIASECATEIEEGWGVSENFELFEDVLPVLEELRRAELRIGLVSNGIRDLTEF